MIVIVVVVALKFLLPVLILRFPFAAGWANFFLDSVDGDLLVPAGLAEPTYQLVDKAADWVTYLFIVIWGWRREIRRELVATFLLRTVGQALFFLTRNEVFLFLFPNLVEPLFLVYVTIARFKGWDRVYDIYRRYALVIWAGILVYKFQDEYVTHIANFDRTDWVRGLFHR